MDPAFPLVWRLRADMAGSGAHGDIDAHIIDLGRYLVGEIREVCGTMETFIKQRPLLEDAGGGLSAKETTGGGAAMGEVTVDDAVSWIGRFENGALANLEATRFAGGRKNHITFEINGSKGSLAFNFEDMNRLKYLERRRPGGRPGVPRYPGHRRRRASVRWSVVAARAHHRVRAHVYAHVRRFREGGALPDTACSRPSPMVWRTNAC